MYRKTLIASASTAVQRIIRKRRIVKFVGFKDIVRFMQNWDLLKSAGPVLVTGHTGFKGTWLTLLLERMGIEVVGYSLAPEINSMYSRLNRHQKINEKFGDIRNLGVTSSFIASTKPGAIFHLAAQPLVLESYANPLETFETNVMGTANILQCAFDTKSVKTVVAVTTDKVYKNLNSGKRFLEDDPLEGKDPYSASKVGAESVIAAWQQIARTSGGPTVSAVRAGNVVGGGDYSSNRIVPDIIRGIENKSVVDIRNAESTRPWQHALDPLFGYGLVALSNLAGKQIKNINLGPLEKSLPVRDVVDSAIDIFGEKLQLRYSNENSKGLESQILDLDSNKARVELNWNPTWTQKEALRATFIWWEKVLENPIAATEVCAIDINTLIDSKS